MKMQIKYLEVQALLLVNTIHSVCKKRGELISRQNYSLIFSLLGSVS